MAKATTSPEQKLFCIVCPQCNKPISRSFDERLWGIEEDEDLRNRLSQHTWSLQDQDHDHLHIVHCAKEAITMWDMHKKNEFQYKDPRPRVPPPAKTAVKVEPPRSPRGGGTSESEPQAWMCEWMGNVLERLDNIEATAERVESEPQAWMCEWMGNVLERLDNIEATAERVESMLLAKDSSSTNPAERGSASASAQRRPVPTIKPRSRSRGRIRKKL